MSELTVEAALRSYADDPDVISRPPRFPRRIPELVLVPSGADGLIVLGGDRRRRFSGGQARQAILAAWDLLDGDSTVEDLIAAHPEVGDVLPGVVALLHRCGYLEEGDCSATDLHGRAEMRSVLGCLAPSAGFFPNREGALESLGAARVAVCAPEAVAESMLRTLRVAGVDAHDVKTGRGEVLPTHGVLVLDENPVDRALLDRWRANRTPVVLGHRDAGFVGIGPVWIPHTSTCPVCVQSGVRGVVEEGQAPSDRWLSEAIVHHLIAMLAGIPPVPQTQVSVLHRIVGDHWSDTSVVHARTPGCELCGLDGRGRLADGSPEQLAWRALSTTLTPPAEFFSSRTHEQHYRPSNMALGSAPEDEVDGYEVALSSATRLFAADGDSANELTALGDALRAGFGFDPDAVTGFHKLAPTGGNLISPVGYVCLRREYDHIVPGVYRYHARNHSLVRVGDGRSYQALNTWLGSVAEGASWTIIGISRLKRLRPKYHRFTERIGLLDGGAALTYLLQSVLAFGWRLVEHTHYDPHRLLTLLHLPADGIAYSAFCVVSAAPRSDTKREVDPRLTSLKPRFVGVGRDTEANHVAAQPATWFLDGPERRRRARRTFSTQLVSKTDAAGIVDAAVDWNNFIVAAGGMPVNVSLSYFLLQTDGQLECVRPSRTSVMIDRSAFIRSFNQPSIGSAPLVIVAQADLEAILHSQGARGVNMMLTRASALLTKAWLLGIARGLVGSLSGGVLEATLRELLEQDGYREFNAFALALGHPA